MPKSSKKSVKRKLGEPTVLETDAKAANTETEHVDSGATGSEGAAAHHEQEEVGEGTENNAGPGHYMTKVLPSNNEGKGHEGQAKDRRVTPPPSSRVTGTALGTARPFTPTCRARRVLKYTMEQTATTIASKTQA